MRVAIIEDNEIDRLNLKTLLENHADVTLAGEAETLEKAIALIDRQAPEAIFLDIHLGRQRGFKVLEQVKHQPLTIITTSHPHYAISGFEIDAVDYLLKPLESEPLARALGRLRHRLQNKASAAEQQLSLDSLQMFKHGTETNFVPLRQIQAIIGERVYTKIIARQNREFLHSRPLREWCEILPRQFKRLDRSVIINLSEIVTIERGVKPRTGVVAFCGTTHKLTLGAVALKALKETVR